MEEKYYTETYNTRKNLVKVLNNACANAILGVAPGKKGSDDFLNEQVKITLKRNKEGDLTVAVFPVNLIGKLNIVTISNKGTLEKVAELEKTPYSEV